MITQTEELYFPATPEGFVLAVEWSKTQPHPEYEDKTLYDKVYDVRLDSYQVLHEINKYKKLKTSK